MRPGLRLFDGYPHTAPRLAAQVRSLQRLLSARGYALVADGRFGRSTESAVKRFQAEHGLDDDGYVGELTWRALLGDGDTAAKPLRRGEAGLRAHLAEAAAYRALVEAAAHDFDLRPALVAAVASRESGWGLALKPKGPAGTGDFVKRSPNANRPGPLPPDGGGFGRGLMQIDFDAHAFARVGQWADPEANLRYGCRVLAQNRAFFVRRASLGGEPLLRASLAAYNCGAGNVLRALRDGRDFDFYTAGRDYAKDTLERSAFFGEHGWN